MKNIYISIGLSVIALILGFSIAKKDNDSFHFARSGSVVVMIAATFAASDLKKKISSAPSFAIQQMSNDTNEYYERYRKAGLSDDQLKKILIDVKDETVSEIQDMVDRYLNRILRIELSLGLIGTFVWGFGDLIILKG
jgi:hypothetical protein